jgi:Mn-dependent DtxR family transcriptional regulator
VEGIEHHLSWESITCIENLVQFLSVHPEVVQHLQSLKEAEEDINTP